MNDLGEMIARKMFEKKVNEDSFQAIFEKIEQINFGNLGLILTDEVYNSNRKIFNNFEKTYKHVSKIEAKNVITLLFFAYAALAKYEEMDRKERNVLEDKFTITTDGKYYYEAIFNHRAEIKYIRQKYFSNLGFSDIARGKNSEGCYIATAVYGSYNHPNVLTLRKYRDLRLNSTVLGKIFIKIYYLISPKLTFLFKSNESVNKLSKKILNRIVLILRKKGL